MIERSNYARLLGYPAGKALEGAVAARAEEAIGWYSRRGRPRVYLRPLGREAVGAVTAGAEVEEEVARLWASDRVDEAYFLDRLAAAVVEELAFGLGPRRSPGCGDLPLEEQASLFSHLAPLAPAIELLPSGMLKPVHSLLGIFTLEGGKLPNPCTSCGLPGCRFRRKAA